MPEALADWSFGSSRVSATVGGQLYTKLLGGGRQPAQGNYGTRSAKATALEFSLSISAKPSGVSTSLSLKASANATSFKSALSCSSKPSVGTPSASLKASSPQGLSSGRRTS